MIIFFVQNGFSGIYFPLAGVSISDDTTIRSCCKNLPTVDFVDNFKDYCNNMMDPRITCSGYVALSHKTREVVISYAWVSCFVMFRGLAGPRRANSSSPKLVRHWLPSPLMRMPILETYTSLFASYMIIQCDPFFLNAHRRLYKKMKATLDEALERAPNYNILV